jgi:cytidylate kinase
MAIITIGGNLGAGKTTLAERLAPALRYDELHMGGIFREMAAQRGVSIETFYDDLKKDPTLESEIDDHQSKLMHERDNLVIQGRIAWFFAKGSPFKVINIGLMVDHEIGAKRSAERNENAGKSVQEVSRANAFREKTERERYAALYGITDYLAEEHYDIVLDTSRLTKDEVFEKIFKEIKKRLASVGADSEVHV